MFSDVAAEKQSRKEQYEYYAQHPSYDDSSDHTVSTINDRSDSLRFEVEGVECQDPFATPDENFAVREAKPMINKYRWAHPIPYIEAGCVLLSSQRVDGVFRKTIVLIVDHNDATGSTGIIINR